MSEQAGITTPSDLPFGERLRAEFRRIVAVYRFEMRRSWTPSRFTAWAILVLFPAVITGTFRYNAGYQHDSTWGMVLYLLAAQAIPLLGLLLWVSPVVQVELEGRTWTYIAVRPGGKIAVLAGKYLNGVAWTISAGLCGLTLSMLVARPDVESRLKLFLVLVVLQILGCFAYGALYLALGTIVPRRSMVFAVAYTLVFEVVVSLIPATINQITVQHRLWNLLWYWMAWLPEPEVELTLNDQPPELHLAVLFGYTVILLTIAAVAIRVREYITSPEA